MNTKRILICSLLLATLAGCGATIQPQSGFGALSEADIQQNGNYQELLIALQDANVQLAEKTEATHAEAFARRNLLQDRLVDLALVQLDGEFFAKRESTGIVPVPAIDTIAQGLAGEGDLPAEKWQRVQDRIEQEKSLSHDYVSVLAENLNQDNSDQQKLALFDELHRLSGNQQWLQSKDEFVDKLIADVRDARAEGRYIAQVQTKAALARYARPEDDKLADELASYDARAYENGFLEALGQGDLSQAYGVFTAMSEADNFDRVKVKIEGTSQTMADYFLAKADQAILDSRQLANSMRLYNQALTMYSRFELEPIGSERFKTLVGQLTKRFKQRVKADDYEAALGYLLMIADFDQDNSEYRNQLSGVKAKVQQAAIRKVAATGFVNRSGGMDYSDVLASYITQYLFENIPFDVRIIERQQYEAMLRERERKRQQNLPLPVDYLMTGTIVDAKVDSKERRGKKIMRVTVGRKTTPNPAYNTWLQLSASEREKIAAPAQTIEVEENENVSVGVTEHRKAAVFTLNYQLLEAATDKVLFPGSDSKESSAEDTSTEGIEIGEFVMPFKVADLPSDSKMLDGLAREVALDVGAKLVESLSNQEEKYLADAQQLADDGDCQGHVRAVARAAAMQEMKGLPFSESNTGLKQATLACY